MRHIKNVLIGSLLGVVFLFCLLTLAVCVIGALEHPESYWCGVAVASAVVGLWKIVEAACSQFRSLLGSDTAFKGMATDLQHEE